VAAGWLTQLLMRESEDCSQPASGYGTKVYSGLPTLNSSQLGGVFVCKEYGG